MHSGCPGNGAPVQQPLCAQGPGHSQLPGQRPKTGEGVGPGAQQRRVQQVEGYGWGQERGRGQIQFMGCGKGLVSARSETGGPRMGRAFPSSLHRYRRRRSQCATGP